MEKESFEQAYDKLTKIVHSIETEEVSVDKLAENVKEAYRIIKSCREQLTQIETQVTEIIEQEKE